MAGVTVSVIENRAPVAVDTIVTGAWVITLNSERHIYRDGAVAVRDGVIVEVGKRAAILAAYRAATLIDEPEAIVIPGMTNGHRHLLCCAKGAMPEGGTTLQALRRFIYPSFAALTEQDMHVLAQACGGGDDPLRHDPVRGAGLQPPARGPRGA